MKLFLLSLCAFIAYTNAEQVCYANVVEYCGLSGSEGLAECNAKFGRYIQPFERIVNYATGLIDVSYKYLLIGTHFGTYEQNREGFKKYFRQLSDKAWEDAIDLIKYNNKRGHHMRTLSLKNNNKHLLQLTKYELPELEAMGRALDVHKSLAEEIHSLISTDVEYNHNGKHKINIHRIDPETVSYMEEHFLHQHAEKIREIAGHIHDLQKLMREETTKSLALSIYDDYLLKGL